MRNTKNLYILFDSVKLIYICSIPESYVGHIWPLSVGIRVKKAKIDISSKYFLDIDAKNGWIPMLKSWTYWGKSWVHCFTRHSSFIFVQWKVYVYLPNLKKYLAVIFNPPIYWFLYSKYMVLIFTANSRYFSCTPFGPLK